MITKTSKKRINNTPTLYKRVKKAPRKAYKRKVKQYPILQKKKLSILDYMSLLIPIALIVIIGGAK